MKTTAYAKAGVDIATGDAYSTYCGQVCRESFGNSPFVEVTDYSDGFFRGRRAWDLTNLPSGWKYSAGCDGVGTKVITIVAAGMEETAASNILAMTGGDFTRDGGLGLILLNNLDIASLGGSTNSETYKAAQKLMDGLAKGAKDQDYVLFGGETAEMRDCITSENRGADLKFTWSATLIGVVHPNKLIRGGNLVSGDRIIALEDGVRSNAGSMLRADLRRRYGKNWYNKTSPQARQDIMEAAAPSALYDKFLAHMNGWTTKNFQPVVKAKLIAHLSGGGIRGKFGEDLLFPRGLSAQLTDLWEPPAVLRNCLGNCEVTEEELYSVSGCGQGVLVVLDPRFSELFIDKAEEFGIRGRDAGFVYRTGNSSKPNIKIDSGFSGREIILSP